ncbi:MAG: SDR family oxidoreductase, partial [Leptospiraceae bacterium]|nr:SDR family oxidoreductase [Leptospiraceae bacterium]
MNSRRILITGAGSGIGLETALELFHRGHQVIGIIRNQKKFNAMWKERSTEPPPFSIINFDVTDEKKAATAVARILKEGPVDVLINNAGYGQYGCFEELPGSDYRQQFETNVFGLMQMTRLVLPSMRKRGKGSILNVSSILGRVALPTGTPYCSSKWAVSGFTRALRFELAPLGIQVCGVEPGLIRTSFKANMQ